MVKVRPELDLLAVACTAQMIVEGGNKSYLTFNALKGNARFGVLRRAPFQGDKCSDGLQRVFNPVIDLASQYFFVSDDSPQIELCHDLLSENVNRFALQ